jgi:hypothetical protein
MRLHFRVLFYGVKKMRWAGHVAQIREKRNAYRILGGNPEGKRPLDLMEIIWGSVD